jgi:cadmium resistance protein CadD (predicted permease)
VPLVVGFILYMLVGLLHADGPTNNHRAVLAVYASSARRTAVHLGQFVGMAVLIAELLALYFALDLRAVGAAWLARLGAFSAMVALGLYAILQAGATGSRSNRLLMLS